MNMIWEFIKANFHVGAAIMLWKAYCFIRALIFLQPQLKFGSYLFKLSQLNYKEIELLNLWLSFKPQNIEKIVFQDLIECLAIGENITVSYKENNKKVLTKEYINFFKQQRKKQLIPLDSLHRKGFLIDGPRGSFGQQDIYALKQLNPAFIESLRKL